MSKSLIQRAGLLAVTALTAATLVACGGDSSAPLATKIVATKDLGITISAGTTEAAAIVAELTKAPYTFNKDIVLNSATYTQPVTITVTGSSATNLKFSLEDSSTPTKKTTQGDLTFGSCVFQRDTAGGGGPAVAFAPCTITLKTSGQTFTPGVDTTSNLLWNLDGTNPSSLVPVTIRVASDGTVTLVIGTSTITLGVVTVTAATGATGSN
jgi:hypothetical protein